MQAICWFGCKCDARPCQRCAGNNARYSLITSLYTAQAVPAERAASPGALGAAKEIERDYTEQSLLALQLAAAKESLNWDQESGGQEASSPSTQATTTAYAAKCPPASQQMDEEEADEGGQGKHTSIAPGEEHNFGREKEKTQEMLDAPLCQRQGEGAGELAQGEDGGGGRDGLSGIMRRHEAKIAYAELGETSAKASMLSLDQAEPSEKPVMEVWEGGALVTQRMVKKEQENFSQQLLQPHPLQAQPSTSLHKQSLLEEEMLHEMKRTNQEALAADRLVQALLHSHPALSHDASNNAQASRVPSRASKSYATAHRVYGRGQAVALQSLPGSRYTLAHIAARLLEEVYFCHFFVVLEEGYFCHFRVVFCPLDDVHLCVVYQRACAGTATYACKYV